MAASRRKIAVRALSVGLCGLFLFAGLLSKLIYFAEASEQFTSKFGYAGVFALFIGLCETAGAVGLLVPRVATLAATGLGLIMIGASVSHVRAGDPWSVAAFPIGVLGLLAIVALARRRDLDLRPARTGS